MMKKPLKWLNWRNGISLGVGLVVLGIAIALATGRLKASIGGGKTVVTSVKTTVGGVETTTTTTPQEAKTLWDLFNLAGVVAVPIVLGVLGFRLQAQQQKQNEAQKHRELEQAEKLAAVEREVAEQNRQEEALQNYYDKVSALVVDKNLLAISAKVAKVEKDPDSEEMSTASATVDTVTPEERQLLDVSVDVIRARTLTTLRKLDRTRKTSLIRFLLEAEVITRLKLNLAEAELEATNLYKGNLVGANLLFANLKWTNLNEANLAGANLEGANLVGAKLLFANLARADLCEANLKGADLGSAKLEGARLWEANLEGVDLRCANLEGVDLSGANLEGANLSSANLERACLWKANLEGANLDRANLKGTILNEANLEGAKLYHANLEGATLIEGARLEGTKLFGTNLEGASLVEANLERAKLCRTILPKDIDINPNRDCKELGQVSYFDNLLVDSHEKHEYKWVRSISGIPPNIRDDVNLDEANLK